MKKFLAVLLLVFAATMAYADTANVQLVDAPWAPAGPYLFNVTPTSPAGPTFQQWLVCWSELNVPPTSVPPGNAYNVYSIATVPVPGPFNETLTQYKEIAWLAGQLIANPGNPDIQVAVWLAAGLENGSALPHTAAADTWLAAAAAAVAGGYNADGAVFYIASDSAPGQGPQPLVGFVPEPGSLILLGTGLVSAAGAIRRKLSV